MVFRSFIGPKVIDQPKKEDRILFN